MTNKARLTSEELAGAMSEFWCYLTPQERDEVVDNVVVRSVKKGEYIYHSDEEPVYLICIAQGTVKLEKFGVGGRTQIMRLLMASQCFGYRSFFADEAHVTQAVAVEQCQLVCLPMNIVEKMVRENGNLALYFIRELAHDLGVSDKRTVNLTQKHIRGRLADSIIFLIDKYGLDADGCSLNIYLSREELACLSNMTTSNAIRTLGEFVKEGILLVDGRRIKVLQPEKLHRINACG